MMDKRQLYVCGDSFSECAFLDNHYDCWVYQLAQELDNKVLNDSLGGGSNYRTVRKTIETTIAVHNTISTAIVVWTDPTRYEIPGDEDDNGYIRCFHNTAQEHYLVNNWLDQIQLLERYFSMLPMEYYFVNAFHSTEKYTADRSTKKYTADAISTGIITDKIKRLNHSRWLLPIDTHMHEWAELNGGLLADGHLNIEANRNFTEYALEVIYSRRQFHIW